MYTYEVCNVFDNDRKVKIVGRSKKEAKRKTEQFLKHQPYYKFLVRYPGDGNTK